MTSKKSEEAGQGTHAIFFFNLFYVLLKYIHIFSMCCHNSLLQLVPRNQYSSLAFVSLHNCAVGQAAFASLIMAINNIEFHFTVGLYDLKGYSSLNGSVKILHS